MFRSCPSNHYNNNNENDNSKSNNSNISNNDTKSLVIIIAIKDMVEVINIAVYNYEWMGSV